MDRSEYTKQYYVDHREERLAYQRAYNVSHKDEIRAYRDSRRDDRLAYSRAYDVSHRDERSAYRASHRDRMRAYTEEHGDAKRERDRVVHGEFVEWLQILRTNNGCEDCETHEGGLHHHHVDPDTKLHNVSEMFNYSLDALEDELEKCVVLCPSCHTKRHVELRTVAA